MKAAGELTALSAVLKRKQRRCPCQKKKKRRKENGPFTTSPCAKSVAQDEFPRQHVPRRCPWYLRGHSWSSTTDSAGVFIRGGKEPRVRCDSRGGGENIAVYFNLKCIYRIYSIPLLTEGRTQRKLKETRLPFNYNNVLLSWNFKTIYILYKLLRQMYTNFFSTRVFISALFTVDWGVCSSSTRRGRERSMSLNVELQEHEAVTGKIHSVALKPCDVWQGCTCVTEMTLPELGS